MHSELKDIDTLDKTDTETISAFVFTDSLVVYISQDEDGYVISRQNNLDLHLGCHTCSFSYSTMRPDGRLVGRTVTCMITKISRNARLPHFLRYGTTLAPAWSSAIIFAPRTHCSPETELWEETAPASLLCSLSHYKETWGKTPITRVGLPHTCSPSITHKTQPQLYSQ